jgi:hypothetical protein
MCLKPAVLNWPSQVSLLRNILTKTIMYTYNTTSPLGTDLNPNGTEAPFAKPDLNPKCVRY